MAFYPYVIVGGGMTADAAAKAIRERQPGADICMISSEPHAPYNRPPLTKGLWKNTKLESIERRTNQLGIDFIAGRTVDRIEPRAHRLTDDLGNGYTYGKLLLATGAEPRRFPTDNARVIYYRTVDDYFQVREQASPESRIIVIGGGFIGSELAASLAMNKVETIMIFPDDGICGRLLPKKLSEFMTDFYRKQNVEMLAGTTVESIELGAMEKAAVKFKSRDGREKTIGADLVIAGIGVIPRTRLAEESGLETANGIVVNNRLQTSHQDIYAAGDVALFYSPDLDTQIRVEHEDNANTMGEAAGRNMAGESLDYTHLPFFYSDLFTYGYEAIGETDAKLDTVADWEDQNENGIIYYLRDGLVRGVLTWNLFGKMDEARDVIRERRIFSRPEDLKSRIQMQ